MEKLKLEIPNESHKKEYDNMIQEWKKYENIFDTSPGALFMGKNYEEFLEITHKYISNSDTGVNSTLFFLLSGNKIIGGLQVRHNLNNIILSSFGGHIGYGIVPDERGKGYGNKILELGLLEAKKLGIDNVMISCSKNNFASKKVIENNGGIFQREYIIEENLGLPELTGKQELIFNIKI